MHRVYSRSLFVRFTAVLLATAIGTTAYAAKNKDENSPPTEAPNAEFAQPMSKVQEQAVNAMVVLGCKIKKQLPNYVEGKRSRKVGVFVGSGGETLRVWLTEADGITSIKVKTDRTFAGGAGQKNWDEELVEEIKKAFVD